MKFTLFTANTTGQQANTLYPNQVVISSMQDLLTAIKTDNTCAKFKDHKRNIANFIKADCLVMDCDNNHSDDTTAWIKPEDIQKYFDGVTHAITFSRNHMKAKHGKAPRPKFHVYFPIKKMTNAQAYAELKHEIQSFFPYFDGNALDAARFVFGVTNQEIVWVEGNETVDQFIMSQRFFNQTNHTTTISQGNRNSTLSHFAGRVIMRLGNTDEAYQAFMDEAAKCDPPLADQELNTIWQSAIKFGARMAKQPGYIPPTQYGQQDEKLKPADYSDTGQTYAFANYCQDRVTYTNQTGFMWFDGKVWQESEALALGEVQRFTDKQLAYADSLVATAATHIKKNGVAQMLKIMSKAKAYQAFSEEQIKSYEEYEAAKQFRDFVIKERSVRGIAGCLSNSRPKLVREINDFDADPFLLNTPAGPYNLKKGLTGKQDIKSSELVTKMTDFSPSNQGTDLWQEALQTFFCNDQALIDYVQEIVGLVAIGQVFLEALIIAYGDGRNGKSTFWNTIANVMGSYTGHLSADALTAGVRRNVKPEMAEVKGKRLIISAELEEGKRLNTSTIKQLCSTDEIYAEKKYMKPFSFVPSHTLVLYTNYLPKVGGNDDGIWRRLIVIPFKAKIAGKSDIKNYTDYLTKNAGEAVMQWIIEGAQKIIAANFQPTVPPVVQDAIKAYHAENDWLGNFLEECCEIDPSYSEKSGEFYNEYRLYCQRQGEYIRNSADFYTALKFAGFGRKRSTNGRFITGVRLKNTDFDFLA